MSDNDTKKSLTGPFQSKGNPETYYVYDQSGKQIVPSTDLLFAGTVTAIIDDPDIGPFRLNEEKGLVGFGAPKGTAFDF